MTSLTRYLFLVNAPVILIALILPFTTFISYSTAIYFLILFFCIYFVSGNLYHLYYSHKQFKLNQTFEKITALLGLFVMVGDPINYSKTHRWHHAHSDTDKDLHSPIHGKWHSLVGWMFKENKVPVFCVRDLISNRYLNFLANHQIKIIWSGLALTFIIDRALFSALIYVMVAGFSLEMLTNAFAHDVNLKTAKNNKFLAWLCLSTLHGNHHSNPGISNCDDPWRFVKKFLMHLKLLEEK